jgi:hypothetical protein
MQYKKRKTMRAFSRRIKLLHIVGVLIVGFYSSLLTIDSYLSSMRKLQQQQRVSVADAAEHTIVDHKQYSQSIPINYIHDEQRPKKIKLTPKSNTTNRNNQLIHQEAQSFPRWIGSIGIEAIQDSINVAMSGELRFDRAHRVYIITDDGHMYEATIPRPVDADQAPYRRAKTMETFAMQVLSYVRSSRNDDAVRYPYLNAVLDAGGFAYIANYADSKFCSEETPFIDETWKPLRSSNDVPIFTLSSPINCQRAFPIPTYETIEQSDLAWNELIPHYNVIYPRSSQYRKAIWRGAPTGDRDPYHNPRIQLCIYAMDRPDILDVKIVKRRPHWDISTSNNTSRNITPFNETQFLGDKIPMEDFQKYRAIIDVDGHSWSSRFGKLLCYTSVIVKVQPNDVDYFHPQLQPWVHYIPVHTNLSNLYDMVSYAISDDPKIVEIIKNANQWCLHHMNHRSIKHDMAAIWDIYAYHLLLDHENVAALTTTSIGSISSSRVDLSHLSSRYGSYWGARQPSLLRRYNFTQVYE